MYVNNEFGHIIKGDINSAKFQVPVSNNKFIIKQLTNDLDIFIYKTTVKHNLPMEFFNEWEYFTIKHFKI